MVNLLQAEKLGQDITQALDTTQTAAKHANHYQTALLLRATVLDIPLLPSLLFLQIRTRSDSIL